jgi:hypothetical protein
MQCTFNLTALPFWAKFNLYSTENVLRVAVVWSGLLLKESGHFAVSCQSLCRMIVVYVAANRWQESSSVAKPMDPVRWKAVTCSSWGWLGKCCMSLEFVYPIKVIPFLATPVFFSGSVLIVASFGYNEKSNAILLVTEVSAEQSLYHLQNFYCCIILTGVSNNHYVFMRSRICITMHISKNVKSRIIQRKERLKNQSCWLPFASSERHPTTFGLTEPFLKMVFRFGYNRMPALRWSRWNPLPKHVPCFSKIAVDARIFRLHSPLSRLKVSIRFIIHWSAPRASSVSLSF